MRGKGWLFWFSLASARITPAYAGKSGIITVEVSYMQDHPRLCGEKRRHSSFVYDFIGSPPPMRGKATIRPTGFKLMRITPAYAGKSVDRQAVIVRERDHPRLCGEK